MPSLHLSGEFASYEVGKTAQQAPKPLIKFSTGDYY